jgi:hypothetical protein
VLIQNLRDEMRQKMEFESQTYSNELKILTLAEDAMMELKRFQILLEQISELVEKRERRKRWRKFFNKDENLIRYRVDFVSLLSETKPIWSTKEKANYRTRDSLHKMNNNLLEGRCKQTRC